MSFHDNLKQTFQNFKDTFIGSTDISSIGNGKITGAISTLNTGKQKTLIAGENITIAQDGTISASGGSDIDDTITSTVSTWSSNKINVEFQNKQNVLTATDGIRIDSPDTIRLRAYTRDFEFYGDNKQLRINKQYIPDKNYINNFCSYANLLLKNVSNYTRNGITVTFENDWNITFIGTADSEGLIQGSLLSSISSLSKNYRYALIVEGEPLSENFYLTLYYVIGSQIRTVDIYTNRYELVDFDEGESVSLKVNVAPGYTFSELTYYKFYLVPILEPLDKIVAPIESVSTSSTREYSIGKHLINDGDYYKVIDSIDIGDALVNTGVNANIKAALIGDEISSLAIAETELSSEIETFSEAIDDKQDKLTAGTGITITNNVISSSAAGVKLEIVQTLPVSDIDPQTIYLVPSSAPGTSNVYDEYIYVNNAWENIGSTSVDLTNYYTKTEVGSLFTSQSTAQSEVDSSQNVSISSLSTENASQTSQITSLSISASETASVVSSLSTAQSTQAVTISSLSTDTSELGSEVTELSSEVADKQDALIPGTGIEINEYNVISATGGGAVLYWEEIYPTSSSESNTTSESESQSES